MFEMKNRKLSKGSLEYVASNDCSNWPSFKSQDNSKEKISQDNISEKYREEFSRGGVFLGWRVLRGDLPWG